MVAALNGYLRRLPVWAVWLIALIPLGLLMFFWQWERLIFYHVDYKAGSVPADVKLIDYLAVFVTPAVMTKWEWGATLGQGYAYLQSGFYALSASA